MLGEDIPPALLEFLSLPLILSYYFLLSFPLLLLSSLFSFALYSLPFSSPLEFCLASVFVLVLVLVPVSGHQSGATPSPPISLPYVRGHFLTLLPLTSSLSSRRKEKQGPCFFVCWMWDEMIPVHEWRGGASFVCSFGIKVCHWSLVSQLFIRRYLYSL